MPTEPERCGRDLETASSARGADGLKVEELQRGRQEWWDARFTALLLEVIPRDTVDLVDLGCGTGHAAHVLLPALPRLRYVGIDIDAERVAICTRAFSSWGERACALQGDAVSLPLARESVDVLLTVTTLEHIVDVPAALAEAWRALRVGGRLVAAEPDNLCQLLRFDGPLPGLNEAFETLFAKLIALRSPADLAIGPKLPRLIREAGFTNVQALVHAVQSMHDERATVFLDRLSSVLDTIAGFGALPDDDPELSAARGLVEHFRSVLADRAGLSAHVVPMWRCVGTKSAASLSVP